VGAGLAFVATSDNSGGGGGGVTGVDVGGADSASAGTFGKEFDGRVVSTGAAVLSWV